MPVLSLKTPFASVIFEFEMDNAEHVRKKQLNSFYFPITGLVLVGAGKKMEGTGKDERKAKERRKKEAERADINGK